MKLSLLLLGLLGVTCALNVFKPFSLNLLVQPIKKPISLTGPFAAVVAVKALTVAKVALLSAIKTNALVVKPLALYIGKKHIIDKFVDKFYNHKHTVEKEVNLNVQIPKYASSRPVSHSIKPPIHPRKTYHKQPPVVSESAALNFPQNVYHIHYYPNQEDGTFYHTPNLYQDPYFPLGSEGRRVVKSAPHQQPTQNKPPMFEMIQKLPEWYNYPRQGPPSVAPTYPGPQPNMAPTYGVQQNYLPPQGNLYNPIMVQPYVQHGNTQPPPSNLAPSNSYHANLAPLQNHPPQFQHIQNALPSENSYGQRQIINAGFPPMNNVPYKPVQMPLLHPQTGNVNFTQRISTSNNDFAHSTQHAYRSPGSQGFLNQAPYQQQQQHYYQGGGYTQHYQSTSQERFNEAYRKWYDQYYKGFPNPATNSLTPSPNFDESLKHFPVGEENLGALKNTVTNYINGILKQDRKGDCPKRLLCEIEALIKKLNFKAANTKLMLRLRRNDQTNLIQRNLTFVPQVSPQIFNLNTNFECQKQFSKCTTLPVQDVLAKIVTVRFD